MRLVKPLSLSVLVLFKDYGAAIRAVELCLPVSESHVPLAVCLLEGQPPQGRVRLPERVDLRCFELCSREIGKLFLVLSLVPQLLATLVLDYALRQCRHRDEGQLEVVVTLTRLLLLHQRGQRDLFIRVFGPLRLVRGVLVLDEAVVARGGVPHACAVVVRPMDEHGVLPVGRGRADHAECVVRRRHVPSALVHDLHVIKDEGSSARVGL